MVWGFFSLAIMWAISYDASTASAVVDWQKHSRLAISIILKESFLLWIKLKAYLDGQGVLFEDDVASDLVSKRRCSDFQNISHIVVQLDHLLWYQ